MFKNRQYIVDAHCHMQFPIYDNDREAAIRHAQEAGVKMIVAGTQISTSQTAIELAHKYQETIWATVGFHPSHAVTRSEQDTGGATNRNHVILRQAQDVSWHHDVNEQKENAPEKFDIKKLKELAKDPKVVGIGECGLDYYRLATSDERLVTSIKEGQKKIFMEMAGLASELKKPLIIHCRPSKGTDDAYDDLFDLLSGGPQIEFKVLHCFTGNLEVAKKMAETGFYFTLGGAVTFPDKKDKNKCAYDDIIKYLPLDRIMTETDAPYLAPVPYRGKRNEPLFVVEVIKKIAEVKKMPSEGLAERISRTVNKIFKI